MGACSTNDHMTVGKGGRIGGEIGEIGEGGGGGGGGLGLSPWARP